MPPNSNSTNTKSRMITTIHEDEPLNDDSFAGQTSESGSGSINLSDLLSNLTKSGGETRKKSSYDDDDMSSIGWFSVTGATPQEQAKQKGGIKGKVDRVPAPQSFAQMAKAFQENAKAWLRRRDVWVLIFVVGSACQLVSASTNQAMADTVRILLTPPSVNDDDAADAQDLPLKKVSSIIVLVRIPP